MSSEIAKGVLRSFCISVLWVALGTIQLPMFYPLVAMEKEVSGIWIGIILAIRPITGILTTPFINRHILKVSVEKTILISGIIYALGFVAFSFVCLIDNTGTFIAVSFLIQLLVGTATAALMIGEQCLLLRYSVKSEREKNLGMFRVASGLGGLLSPMVGSAMYALGGFIATFMSVGVGFLIICPYVYYKLTAAKIEWDAEI